MLRQIQDQYLWRIGTERNVNTPQPGHSGLESSHWTWGTSFSSQLPSLVTEGRLVGGGRHKAGDSRAEGDTGHDMDHLAMGHTPYRWSARSVLKDRTRLLLLHCNRPAVNPRHRAQPSCCHQKHHHFLPKSLSIPKPLLKTQQSSESLALGLAPCWLNLVLSAHVSRWKNTASSWSFSNFSSPWLVTPTTKGSEGSRVTLGSELLRGTTEMKTRVTSGLLVSSTLSSSHLGKVLFVAM